MNEKNHRITTGLRALAKHRAATQPMTFISMTPIDAMTESLAAELIEHLNKKVEELRTAQREVAYASLETVTRLTAELAAAKAALYDQTEGITAEMDYQAAKEKHYEECAVMCERQGEHFGPWFGDLIRSSLPALTDEDASR